MSYIHFSFSFSKYFWNGYGWKLLKQFDSWRVYQGSRRISINNKMDDLVHQASHHREYSNKNSNMEIKTFEIESWTKRNTVMSKMTAFRFVRDFKIMQSLIKSNTSLNYNNGKVSRTATKIASVKFNDNPDTRSGKISRSCIIYKITLDYNHTYAYTPFIFQSQLFMEGSC